jgi:hypothetical protein
MVGCIDGGPIDAGSDAADVRTMDAPDVPVRCTAEASCTGSGGGAVSDLATGRCVECLSSTDTCPGGSYCVGATNRCAAVCRNDDGGAPGVASDAGVGDGGRGAGARYARWESRDAAQSSLVRPAAPNQDLPEPRRRW